MSEELYLDEDFRMLAKTYPADVSAIGVTVLIDYVEALEAELTRRDEIIARLKEDGEKLAETHIYAARYGDTNCIHCARVEDNGNIDHKTDCPITLHRALMKELE